MKRLLTKLTNLFSDLRSTFWRRDWRLYDFFDGTSDISLAWKYLLGGWRQDSLKTYESSLSSFFGSSYAVTFAAGRMALYALLEAMDIGAGDEVILPAFTCVAVSNAILYRKATPVYVDICAQDFNIDASRIEALISPRTKAILAQHTFGQPCDIDEILLLARKYKLRVIEDCAHAIGAKHSGRFLGMFGDAAFSSTDHTKIFSTNTGGFALTSDPPLARALFSIQSKSATLPWYSEFRIFFQYPVLGFLTLPRIYWIGKQIINRIWRFRLWFFFHDEMQTARPTEYPARLTQFQAYVGLNELNRLESNIRHRRDSAQHLDSILLGRHAILKEGAYLRYSLLVKSPELWERALGQYYVVGRWYSTVTHGREQDFDAVCYRTGSCPIAEWTARHIINFPTHFRITGEALNRFAALLDRTDLRADILTSEELKFIFPSLD